MASATGVDLGWEIFVFGPDGTAVQVRECGVYDPDRVGHLEAERMAGRLRGWLHTRVCNEMLFDRCLDRDDRVALLDLPATLRGLGLDPDFCRVEAVPLGAVCRDAGLAGVGG